MYIEYFIWIVCLENLSIYATATKCDLNLFAPIKLCTMQEMCWLAIVDNLIINSIYKTKKKVYDSISPFILAIISEHTDRFTFTIFDSLGNIDPQIVFQLLGGKQLQRSYHPIY